MIYDKPLTVYDLEPSSSALKRRLLNPRTFYCGEKEVFGNRFFTALTAGERIDMMVELWRADITGEQYAVPADGHVYRIVQAQHGENRDGLPITTLSLRREGSNYDIYADNGNA